MDIRVAFVVVPLLVLVVFDRSFSQETSKLKRLSFGGSISGHVVGKFSNSEKRISKSVGIPDAKVVLKAAGGRAEKNAKTDPEGRFRFSRLVAGTYQICVTSALGDSPDKEVCGENVRIADNAVFLEPHSINERPIDIKDSRLQQFDEDFLALLGDLLVVVFDPPCKVESLDRFLSLKRNDVNSDPVRSNVLAETYYQRIDPFNTKTTLADWWAANGFDPVTGRAPAQNNGHNAAAVAYVNYNDLGFGRNMHCLSKSEGALSCWVANHGEPDQDPDNADLAAANESPDATVTMEFSDFGLFFIQPGFDLSKMRSGTKIPVRDEEKQSFEADIKTLFDFNKREFSFEEFSFFLLNSPTTKFYAYAPPEGSNLAHGEFPRGNAANLDGCGAKHIPGLCLNCHGGDIPDAIYNGTKDTWSVADIREVGQASFREFDTATYLYPGGRNSTNFVEDAMFKKLNQLVVDHSNPSDAIVDLVDAWYDFEGDITQNESYVPPSWSGNGSIYLNTVAKACRTCHVALADSLNWDVKSNLDAYGNGNSLSDNMCNRYMPHARITEKNFSNAQRDQLLSFYNASCQ